MTPPVRFAIFAAPRTGSNLLCGLLNGHPDILCHHGLFNPGGVHLARDRADLIPTLGDMAARDADPAGFLSRVWGVDGRVRAVGFKMNRGECAVAEGLLLDDPSVVKILLRRQNRVRTFVSEEIARFTGAWESYGGQVLPPAPSVCITPDALMRHAELNAAYYARIEAALRASGQDWLETDYEALAKPQELARILVRLGVAPRGILPAICRKRAVTDLRANILNFDELAQALRGTPLSDDLTRPDLPDLVRQPIAS